MRVYYLNTPRSPAPRIVGVRLALRAAQQLEAKRPLSGADRRGAPPPVAQPCTPQLLLPVLPHATGSGPRPCRRRRLGRRYRLGRPAVPVDPASSRPWEKDVRPPPPPPPPSSLHKERRPDPLEDRFCSRLSVATFRGLPPASLRTRARRPTLASRTAPTRAGLSVRAPRPRSRRCGESVPRPAGPEPGAQLAALRPESLDRRAAWPLRHSHTH